MANTAMMKESLVKQRSPAPPTKPTDLVRSVRSHDVKERGKWESG